MLETVDFSNKKMKKAEYKPAYDALVSKLVILQQKAKERDIGMVVLFEGWKGAGKGSRISDILYHLDARDTKVHVTEDVSEEELELTAKSDFGATGFYPSLQQFWKALGNRGGMTFFDRGWYSTLSEQIINYRDSGKAQSKKKQQKQIALSTAKAMDSIKNFEKQLTEDGYIVVKFFLHISEETQRKRLINLYSNPATKWRVSEQDLVRLSFHDSAYKIYDSLLEGTQFDFAPWVLLNGEDKRYVNLKVVETLVNKLEEALAQEEDAEAAAAADKAKTNSATGVTSGLDQGGNDSEKAFEESKIRAAAASALAPKNSRFPIQKNYPVIEQVNHNLVLERPDYKAQLKYEQNRLRELELQMYIKRIPMVIMYEGLDAAGKGGSIKRVAQALDARSYTIFPSPAPSKLELAHPHLWRYWTRLPKAGHVGIYDRSWYGRVLVERIEGFATPSQWARAYDEINEFEQDLINWGAILLKFWVDVSYDVQLQRFRDRENNPDKQWKITSEDWRNREKYPEYCAAVNDMFRLTSTEAAPWIVLESDDKLYARVKALKVINNALEERLRES